MSQKVLLIGCGGSGITTLLRFNEMMAGNPEWRALLWEKVSYMVVDTEVEKANGFVEAVGRQLGAAKKPIIRLVQITRGIHVLDEIVGPNFDLQKDPDAKSRLMPHWWHDANGRPFRAQKIKNLENGAGQCGPVSFMCAWNFLPRLEEEVDSLLREIQAHNIGENNPLANIRVFIVAGLAGGTGRGSWNLIAFKIRQALERRGHLVDPTGIFFDASCFLNVVRKDPDQDVNTKLNSLTGLSELSSWMALADGHAQYSYSLPNLARPDPAGRTDVIRVDPEETVDSRRSPISSAYLICGNNGRGYLADNIAYHEMVAAGLYSLVAGAQFVDPRTINRLTSFGSLAASTFEVDTVRLRAFFEASLRETSIRDMIREADPKSVAAQEAAAFIGAPDDGKSSFFDTIPLVVETKVSVSSVTPPAPGAGNPSLLQRLIAKVKADSPKAVESFEKKLESQNVKTSWAQALAGLTMGDLTKDKLAKLLDEVMAEASLSDLRELLIQKVKESYAMGDQPSLSRARAVVAGLKKAFEDSIEKLNSPILAGKEVYGKPEDVTASFKRIYDEAAKKGFLEFSPFTTPEMKMLANSFAMHQNYAVFFKVKPLLVRKFEEAKTILNEVEGALEKLVGTLEGVADSFRNEATKECGAEQGRTAYDTLFIDENSTAVFESIPNADALVNIYRRILKPIISEKELQALLSSGEVRTFRRDDINAKVNQGLETLLNGSVRWTDDAKDKLAKEFKSLFKANVFLSRGFMDSHFSFENVLKNNLKYWNKLLLETVGNPDQFSNLCDQFRVFLGVTGIMETGAMPSIKWDGLITSIVVSMVGPCKPWIEFKGDNGDYLETVTLLPVTLERAGEDAELARSIERVHRTQAPTVIHRGMVSEGGHRLPVDRIVVFASQKLSQGDRDEHLLDGVTSFAYWKDAKVDERLKLAESSDGAAFFMLNKKGDAYVERERGLGYVSPLFVTDPELSTLRWKPWAPRETMDAVKAREMQVCSALLYAFLGNGLVTEDAQLKTLAERFNWPLPLIKMGGDKSEDFSFTRDPLVWKRGKGTSDIKPVWEPEEKLVTSIDNVFNYLLGNGKPGLDGRNLKAAIEKGRSHLEHLTSELEVFNKNIRPVIGEDAYASMVDARNRWFTTQHRKASKPDQEFWEKLQEAAKRADDEA